MKRASIARLAIPFLVLAIVPVAGSRAQSSLPPREATAPHVAVSLITASSQSPGSIELGLRFRLDPGWHVYWRNPGDSGGPPTVRWVQLPAGWTAGELSWPVPERIPLGPLVNYGYTGDVVLPLTITRPRDGGTGGRPVALVADVRWLVCHDICVPGRARLGLQLPVPEPERARTAEWTRLLAEARRKLPVPAPTGWEASAREQGDSFVVAIRGDAKIGRGVFFPIDEGLVNESAPQKVELSTREVRFTLKKSDQVTTAPKVVRGVVRFESGAAYEVAAPIRR